MELVYHPDHFPELDAYDTLRVTDIATLPLCTAEPTRYFRRYLDASFREAGVTQRVIMESTSIFQLLQGVQVGLGCLISRWGTCCLI